jgi:hypothetical protein
MAANLSKSFGEITGKDPKHEQQLSQFIRTGREGSDSARRSACRISSELGRPLRRMDKRYGFVSMVKQAANANAQPTGDRRA